MSNLLRQAQREWVKQDQIYLPELRQRLAIFNKLYLKNFDKLLYRQINTLVINDIKNEMEAVNARLCGDQAGKRRIRYRMAGNTTKAGKAGN